MLLVEAVMEVVMEAVIASYNGQETYNVPNGGLSIEGLVDGRSLLPAQ